MPQPHKAAIWADWCCPSQASFAHNKRVFLQDKLFGFTIGQDLVKVPITAPVKGSFQTFGVEPGR